MNSYKTLVSLFLKHLIRRKSIWLVGAIFLAMILITVNTINQLNEYLNDGVAYDIATQKTTQQLEAMADSIKLYGFFLIIVVSAMIAPGSRKDGTTQFLVSMSVNRYKIAIAQFFALSIFALFSTLIIHLGYAVPAHYLGAISTPEILFAWLYLFVPFLLLSLVIFSMSLSRSTINTYAIFLLIPYVILPLLEDGFNSLESFFPLSRLIDNAKFMFPNPLSIIAWPQIQLSPLITNPPFPHWTWAFVHIFSATIFWTVLALWLYRKCNFGTRVLTK